MQSSPGIVVVIGTGGTIAGTAARPQDLTGYTAGALPVADLLAAVPALAGARLQAESLAQMDSCDMDHATWVRLARAVSHHLARPEVAGVVVTHGTDTLEETAYFLHHTVNAAKPVVLTAAMRPATAPSPDGPQNLVDAVLLAAGTAGACGVLAVLAGVVHAGNDLRKLHGYRVDAFGSGDAGPVALVQDGGLRCLRDWPVSAPTFAAVLHTDPAKWPTVDIITSHAGARGATLDALVAAGAKGIVLAGTGNGSVHASLLAAARRAQQQGLAVLRASRCVAGGVVGAPADALPSAGDATPAQARVLLLLRLICGGAGA
jgi:L-asparaginase